MKEGRLEARKIFLLEWLKHRDPRPEFLSHDLFMKIPRSFYADDPLNLVRNRGFYQEKPSRKRH